MRAPQQLSKGRIEWLSVHCESRAWSIMLAVPVCAAKQAKQADYNAALVHAGTGLDCLLRVLSQPRAQRTHTLLPLGADQELVMAA